MELFDLRKEYLYSELLEDNVDKNPFKQFEKWFDDAVKAQIYEPNAFSLATATPEGKPSVRVLLLKEITSEGFIFFTNYESNKGKEIEKNNQVAMNFFWIQVQRQVRIQGTIEKISREKSEKYFKSRPISSQIGGIISAQSTVIESREVLEKKYNEYEELHMYEELSMPDNWGGYIVKPENFEFWQGRTSRLHDRLFFQKKDGEWFFVRLSP